MLARYRHESSTHLCSCAEDQHDTQMERKRLSPTYGLSRDDVLSLALVETGDTLDDHVVAFGGSAGKDDILRSSADQFRNVLSGLVNGALGLPPVSVRPAVGVSVLLREERQHLVEHSRVHGSRSLHVEVDRPALRLGG